MDREEEQGLVRRLVAMDERAWTAYSREYSPARRQYVRVHFACDQDALDEIVHLTFVRCVKSIGTFDPSRGGIYEWLKAITRNEGHTRLRKEPFGRVDFPAEAIDTEPLPEEWLARKDARLLVEECLLAMNVRQREALRLKYLEELSVAEIARRLELSPKAAESLLTRSRESFRKVFQEKVRGYDG